mgnify:CR=1 FL=1
MTDGDLRRELKSYTKNSNLNKFMTKSPLVVNENMPSSKALAIMNEKKITSLLVVSEKDYKKKNKILKIKFIFYDQSMGCCKVSKNFHDLLG